MNPKRLQYIRLFTASLMILLGLGGILGFFYPLKIFDVNVAPLLQNILVSFTTFSVIFLFLLFFITVLFGRIYCSTLCPLGIFQEFGLFLFHHKKISPQKNRKIKYLIAALVFGTLFASTSCILRYLDPYSIFGSAFTGSLSGIIILTLIAVLTALKGRYFCTNICPVGTILGLISRYSLYKININPDNCVACGLCTQKCPSGCINVKNKTIDNETCVKCLKCLTLCHNHGIAYIKKHPHRPQSTPPIDLSRRNFLVKAATLSVLVAAYKGGILLSQDIAKKIKSVILPPGAGSPKKFANTCLNCNLCVKNCPMNIIKKANSSVSTVHIEYNKNFCSYECNKCAQICPTGALKRLSLADKKKTQIGLASVNPDVCIQCGLCIRECPNTAITKPHGEFPEINQTKCVGCGACQAVCPASAIKVHPVSKQKQLS